MNIKRHLSF